MQQDDLGYVSRDDIEQIQREELPSIATRALLHLHPTKVLHDASMEHALQLSAADVVESGREFVQLNDSEKQAIFTRNYEHALKRNMDFLAKQGALS